MLHRLLPGIVVKHQVQNALVGNSLGIILDVDMKVVLPIEDLNVLPCTLVDIRRVLFLNELCPSRFGELRIIRMRDRFEKFDSELWYPKVGDDQVFRGELSRLFVGVLLINFMQDQLERTDEEILVFDAYFSLHG